MDVNIGEYKETVIQSWEQIYTFHTNKATEQTEYCSVINQVVNKFNLCLAQLEFYFIILTWKYDNISHDAEKFA